MTYRKAILADAPALAHMRALFLADAGDLATQAQQAEIELILLDYFTSALADDSFAAWIACDGERIVATSGLTFSLVPPSYSNQSGKVAYIMNMFTLREYRRKGIAMKLFERIVEEAKLRGYSKITLHATDMGRPLYEKFGFCDSKGDMVYHV